MIVLSDSSPLIAFARIAQFPLLQQLYGQLIISFQVYEEVVLAGRSLVGAKETSGATWIAVRHLQRPTELANAQAVTGLGVGELSTILLAKEIGADLALIDDLGARRLAQKQGLKVQGCVGTLEACFRKGYLMDLRAAYAELLNQGIYLDRQLLNTSLNAFNLAPL